LQKCVTSLEAFDPRKARKRVPAIVELEAAIDKALSSAFGYGTPAYLRYNQAATLEPDPLVTNTTLRSPVLPPVGGPQRGDAKAHEVRRNFSENKERSIALLRKAIDTLEDADAEPLVVAAKRSTATPIIEAAQESKATHRLSAVHHSARCECRQRAQLHARCERRSRNGVFEPGTVMVLGKAGALHQSQHACDKRVAGVVSGAGDYIASGMSLPACVSKILHGAGYLRSA
jgi:hypothetical protein